MSYFTSHPLVPLLLFGGVWGLAACATTPAAPELSDRAAAAFERQDEDGDGVISEADVRARSEDHFMRLDADGSGDVSWEEYRNQPERGAEGRGGNPARSFTALDRDGSGALTQAELADGALRRFDRQDRNQDGEITQEEMAESLQRERRPRRAADAPPLPRR